MFRTPEEEIRELTKEIYEIKEMLREISGKLVRIEARAKRAFPTVLPRLQSQGNRGGIPRLSTSPTISSQEALKMYDDFVKLAKEGNKEEVQHRIETMGLPDLMVLYRELGIPLGKNKPSRRILLNRVFGRINESMLLSTFNLREKINNKKDVEKE